MRLTPGRVELIVVGASWGGLRALQLVLGGLPAHLECPVVIAQHRSAGEELELAAALGRTSTLPVSDAMDKELLMAGCAYLAPADYHLLVERRGEVALSTAGPVNSARPSIDVLFESAAEAYGSAVAGVMLTGASADGAAGLARIEQAGGLAIVQDPSTAECAVMPAAAMAATTNRLVLPLDRIAGRLAALAGAHRP